MKGSKKKKIKIILLLKPFCTKIYKHLTLSFVFDKKCYLNLNTFVVDANLQKYLYIL